MMHTKTFPLYPTIQTKESETLYKEKLITWIQNLPEKTWINIVMNVTSMEDIPEKELYPAIRFFNANRIIPWLDRNPLKTEQLFVSGAILDAILVQTLNYIAEMWSKQKNGSLSKEEESTFNVYSVLQNDKMWSTLFNTIPEMRDLVEIRSHMGMQNPYTRLLPKNKKTLYNSFCMVDHIVNVWVGWNNKFVYTKEKLEMPDPQTEMIWDLRICAFEDTTAWGVEKWMAACKKYIGLTAIIGMKKPELLTVEQLLKDPILYYAYKIGESKPSRDQFVTQLQLLKSNPPTYDIGSALDMNS